MSNAGTLGLIVAFLWSKCQFFENGKAWCENIFWCRWSAARWMDTHDSNIELIMTKINHHVHNTYSFGPHTCFSLFNALYFCLNSSQYMSNVALFKNKNLHITSRHTTYRHITIQSERKKKKIWNLAIFLELVKINSWILFFNTNSFELNT